MRRRLMHTSKESRPRLKNVMMTRATRMRVPMKISTLARMRVMLQRSSTAITAVRQKMTRKVVPEVDPVMVRINPLDVSPKNKI